MGSRASYQYALPIGLRGLLFRVSSRQEGNLFKDITLPLAIGLVHQGVRAQILPILFQKFGNIQGCKLRLLCMQ